MQLIYRTREAYRQGVKDPKNDLQSKGYQVRNIERIPFSTNLIIECQKLTMKQKVNYIIPIDNCWEFMTKEKGA